MDGLEESKGVLVLAATNLVDAIDPALKRPGCFDEALYVPLPDSEGRHEILQIHTRKLNTKLDDEVDLRQIAEGTKGFSGADLANLCRRVGMIALSEDMSATAVYNRHFQTAIRSVKEPPMVKAACIKQKSKGTEKLLLGQFLQSF